MTSTANEEGWREPTLTEAFLDGASGRVPSIENVQLRSLLGPILVIALVGVLLPDIRAMAAGASYPPFISLFVLVPILAVQAYRLQMRFGRSPTHGLAAALGVLVILPIFLVLLVGASIIVAHAPGESPVERAIDALSSVGDPMLLLVAVLAGTAVVLVVSVAVGRGRRVEREAKLAAAIEHEQTARAAAATVPR
jgi:hypothetical protein